jgi:hypothetical protein
VKSFEIGSHKLSINEPQGWETSASGQRVTLRPIGAPVLPGRAIDFSLVAGTDVRAALDLQLRGCMQLLTDFTVLHVEPRATAAENWTGNDGEENGPFVFGAFRQGVYSMVAEFGVAGSNGSEQLLANSTCLFEEVAMHESVFEQALAEARIEW